MFKRLVLGALVSTVILASSAAFAATQTANEDYNQYGGANASIGVENGKTTWVYAGFEKESPYRKYERRFVNGQPTDDFRYTGEYAVPEWKVSGFEALRTYDNSGNLLGHKVYEYFYLDGKLQYQDDMRTIPVIRYKTGKNGEFVYADAKERWVAGGFELAEPYRIFQLLQYYNPYSAKWEYQYDDTGRIVFRYTGKNASPVITWDIVDPTTLPEYQQAVNEFYTAAKVQGQYKSDFLKGDWGSCNKEWASSFFDNIPVVLEKVVEGIHTGIYTNVNGPTYYVPAWKYGGFEIDTPYRIYERLYLLRPGDMKMIEQGAIPESGITVNQEIDKNGIITDVVRYSGDFYTPKTETIYFGN